MRLVRWSVEHPRLCIVLTLLVTALFAVVLPLANVIYPAFQKTPGDAGAVWQALQKQIVDTDPENMLPQTEPVRVFHHEMQNKFRMSDMIVVGVVNTQHPEGVFNVDSLSKIYELTEHAYKFHRQVPQQLRPAEADAADETVRRWEGIIRRDVIAPSNLDHIQSAGKGVVKFEWLMAAAPKDETEARQIKARIMSQQMLRGMLVSEDGKALCLYFPLTAKDLSYEVYSYLLKKIATFQGPEQFHITGLPVAEDTFGVEMFIQMAYAGPVAMLLIFLLMWVFFKKLVLIIAPMILTMITCACTMGLLVGTGYTLHIMSSMIPIFIMPIAILDSIHILSVFFDKYPRYQDRTKTIMATMEELFQPMLYTSLTTMAGFASLVSAPIPPVQVFGIFVAMGVALAWIFTVTFIPAYTMLIADKSLANYGLQAKHQEQPHHGSALTSLLFRCGTITGTHAKTIVVIFGIFFGLGIYGITRINVNDNPVKWFTASHPIRVADRVLNEHFGGTYMAHLTLAAAQPLQNVETARDNMKLKLAAFALQSPAVMQIEPRVQGVLYQTAQESASVEMFYKKLTDTLWSMADTGEPAWEEAAKTLEAEAKAQTHIFLRPDVLEYLDKLQQQLARTKIVGKSTSVADIVCKIHQELNEGEMSYYKIPGSLAAVSQCLISFQNSHRPESLWHFVTPDYSRCNLWIQLVSGDNRDMEQVERSVQEFFRTTPPPLPMKFEWFGLTYINVIWQNKMVTGMMNSFVGSFVVVFIMMVFLLRSFFLGLLSMIPLLVTIVAIYGFLGIIGKDYDMPVAVLSSLTLGLAIDFAIHFLARGQMLMKEHGTWAKTVGPLFDEPARAIARNIIVIAVAFLPLLLAPLVPYQTVGIFLATILSLSGLATLLMLPALLTLTQKWVFKKAAEKK